MWVGSLFSLSKSHCVILLWSLNNALLHPAEGAAASRLDRTTEVTKLPFSWTVIYHVNLGESFEMLEEFSPFSGICSVKWNAASNIWTEMLEHAWFLTRSALYFTWHEVKEFHAARHICNSHLLCRSLIHMLQVTVVSVSVADLVIAIHTFSPLKSSPVNNILLFEFWNKNKMFILLCVMYSHTYKPFLPCYSFWKSHIESNGPK